MPLTQVAFTFIVRIAMRCARSDKMREAVKRRTVPALSGVFPLRGLRMPCRARCSSSWPYTALAAFTLVLLAGCAPMGQPASTSAPQGISKLDATRNELQKTDVKQGNGTEATPGKAVVVHYTGWLYDTSKPDSRGAKFDSSRDRGVPFGFVLGAGRVIKGWDEGVAGMKVGGQRTLVIPPALGYGERGAGGVIPPNATLIFDVELLDVK